MPKKDASLEIYLLGPFRILVDGQLVAARQFTRHKPKLLVKLPTNRRIGRGSRLCRVNVNGICI